MDEKKQYKEGTVCISSQEYRDLVAEAAEAKKDADKYRSENWRKDDEIKKLTEQINTMKQTLDHYCKFLHDQELTQKYKLFVMELKGVEVD